MTWRHLQWFALCHLSQSLRGDSVSLKNADWTKPLSQVDKRSAYHSYYICTISESSNTRIGRELCRTRTLHIALLNASRKECAKPSKFSPQGVVTHSHSTTSTATAQTIPIAAKVRSAPSMSTRSKTPSLCANYVGRKPRQRCTLSSMKRDER